MRKWERGGGERGKRGSGREGKRKGEEEEKELKVERGEAEMEE